MHEVRADTGLLDDPVAEDIRMHRKLRLYSQLEGGHVRKVALWINVT